MKKQLIIAITSSLFVLLCTFYYFYQHYLTNTLFSLNITTILLLVLMSSLGIYISISGYRIKIGKVNFDELKYETQQNWGAFRKAIHNPENIKRTCLIGTYTFPYFLGLGILSDAIRGF